MNFKNLIELYKKKREKYGENVYNRISELFEEAKLIHKKDWLKNPTKYKDHEQSWRAFKGKNLEKLIIYIIKYEIEKLGLKIVEGSLLERKNNRHLSLELSKIKRNLLIDYGEFGFHLPDVDIIIYDPKNYRIIAVISSKVTLRERIAQTGYWSLKLKQDKTTKHIKVFFITPDEDKTLNYKKPAKKGRAIVEIDTDGSYVMSDENIEESSKVKKFKYFISDLKKIIYDKKQNSK